MHGHLASKNENKRQKIGRLFEVMTVGTTDGGLVLVRWAVCFNTHELVWWLYTHARMHMNCLHATLTRTQASTHARNTHTYTQPRTHATLTCTHARWMHTPHDQHTCSRSSGQSTPACAHIRPWQTHTQPGDSRARVGALSCLCKSVFIWPFAFVNW